LRRAAGLFAQREIAAAEGLRWGWLATAAAWTLWDDEGWHKLLVQQLQSLRDAGLLAHLTLYLNSLAFVTAWRGELAMAGSLIAEADAIAEATQTRHGRNAAMILAGFRGKEGEAPALIEVEPGSAAAAGRGHSSRVSQWVASVLYNGLGRYEEALEAAERASELGRPTLGFSAWALVELIEAASRTGNTQLALEALDRLADATIACETDWGLGVLARSRALLSEGAGTEGSYREAIDRLSRTKLRPELARAHLLYGEWLRRENRRLDARAELRTAHHLFLEIGMEAFANRARNELNATGEHTRARAPEARDDLTAQERQIAELALDGLSNPEIGARLFLSARTVEWHLRHVFTKLGIRSRRELHKVLPVPSAPVVAD
jgi:ATP/maltotriose-dependent transcriptional regulator MalT